MFYGYISVYNNLKYLTSLDLQQKTTRDIDSIV